MKTPSLAPYVYNAEGEPLYGGAPPLCGPGGVFVTHPICHMLFDTSRNDDPGAADAIWAIADDIEQTGLADDALSRLIDVLDRGGVLALHATCEDDMQIGRAILLRMAGGWHA